MLVMKTAQDTFQPGWLAGIPGRYAGRGLVHRGMKDAKFIRISHKERMRQVKYRAEHEDKLQENRERKLWEEMQQLKKSCAADNVSEKEREMLSEFRRFGLL